MIRVERLQAQHDEMVGTLEECRVELRQAMLNSLMCLDFYRDFENYLGEHRYSAREPSLL